MNSYQQRASVKIWAGSLILVALQLVSLQSRADLPCDADQERVFEYETPYPQMMTASLVTTFASTLAAWPIENKSGNQNPAWLATFFFAWATGAIEGPSCHDIPAHYVDGITIADEKTARTPDLEAHSRMMRKFMGMHAVNLLILTAVFLDNENAGVRATTFLAAASPLLGYGAFKLMTQQQQEENERVRVNSLLLPEPGTAGFRFLFTLSTSLP